jgi:hypothetical protein
LTWHDVKLTACCCDVLQGIDGFAADQKKLEEQLAKLAGGKKL